MILDDIVEKKKIRLAERKKNITLEQIKNKADKIVEEENKTITGYVNKFKDA